MNFSKVGQVAAITALALLPAVAPAQTSFESQVRDKATKSVALLEKVNKNWITKQQCASCHNNILASMAFTTARQHGIAVDDAFVVKMVTHNLKHMSDLDTAVQYNDIIDPTLFDAMALTSARMAGIPANMAYAARVRGIASRQQAGGNWVSFDRRPPASSSEFTAAAWSINAMENYLPARATEEKTMRVDRAVNFLKTATAADTEDQVFRVLGLSWAGVSRAEMKPFTSSLIALQREDGGWSQLPTRESDAYATATAVYALQEAGFSTKNAAVQRGLEYLMRTQKDDGTWHVKTRIHGPAPVSPPYYESGFPYAKDQYISATATNWASMALVRALPKVEAPALALNLPVAESADWIETALFGTVDELKQMLASGVDVNKTTAGGTTLLMLCANDIDKVRVLVARGADVNARAKTRYTALMVAANMGGTTEVVRYLLNNGAEVMARKDEPARFGANAAFLAVYSGEVEKAALIMDKGVGPIQMMVMGGFIPMDTMFAAVTNGDAAMTKLLVDRGADVNMAANPWGITPLMFAAINGRDQVAKVLLNAGAKLEINDKAGMTALLYAATHDRNDDAVLKTLLKAGANRSAKSKEGKTAVELATMYHHPVLLAALTMDQMSDE